MSNFISIAQITDTHLFENINGCLAGIPTDSSFKEVLATIKQNIPKVDLLLLTGDLSQDGSVGSYQRLRDTLDDFELPAYCLAGNHDDLTIMQTNLPSKYVHLRRSLNIGNWQILLLSSVVVGAVHGYLADTELDWLEQKLIAEPDLHTLIAFHHPAIPIGSPWMDDICLTNQDQFWGICDRYSQIKVVLNGHAHQDFDLIHETPHSFVRYFVSPSTCVQFQPQTANFQIDNQPPGFRHLCLFEDGSIQTKIHRLKNNKFIADHNAMTY